MCPRGRFRNFKGNFQAEFSQPFTRAITQKGPWICPCVPLLEVSLCHTICASLQSNSTLPLVLVAFSLNGTFLGVHEEVTQQLFLCKERSSHSRAAWRVGVHYYSTVRRGGGGFCGNSLQSWQCLNYNLIN
jgi:hypothetical protein